MTQFIVEHNILRFAGNKLPCAIGVNGLSDHKKEGDGCTPVGTFSFRECWYRADRIEAPVTGLPLRIITPEDGWCDDAAHPAYNTHVTLPFPARHEKLWREDHVYDLIIPLGYNDAPVIPGLGSAIFMHVAREHYEGTEGCVALKKEDLLSLLPLLSQGDHIVILDTDSGVNR